MDALKVTREVAEEDVKTWLDQKKIFPSIRDAQKASIELLTEAITQGYLIFNKEKNSWDHILLHPLNQEVVTTSLTYVGRLNDRMLQQYMKGVSQGDGDARLVSYICALTGAARGIIMNLDTTDKSIASAIAVFFI